MEKRIFFVVVGVLKVVMFKKKFLVGDIVIIVDE